MGVGVGKCDGDGENECSLPECHPECERSEAYRRVFGNRKNWEWEWENVMVMVKINVAYRNVTLSANEVERIEGCLLDSREWELGMGRFYKHF